MPASTGPPIRTHVRSAAPRLPSYSWATPSPPVRRAQTLLASIREDGVLAFISLQMASVALARAQDMSLYGASKAPLNSLLRSWG